jgi:hypothetical protein
MPVVCIKVVLIVHLYMDDKTAAQKCVQLIK